MIIKNILIFHKSKKLNSEHLITIFLNFENLVEALISCGDI